MNNLAAEKCQGVLVHVFVGGQSKLPKIGTQPPDLTMPVPTRYQLEQNYPNPFNASTVIRYALPAPGQVRLDIYNLRGERVRTLVDADRAAGTHQVSWDGRNDMNEPVASGIYICRFQAGDVTYSRRLILLK